MKFLNWLIEAIKTLIAYFSVEGRIKDKVVEDFTEFLGSKTVDLEGVQGVLANLGIELGGAVVGEAIDFTKKHKNTLVSMTREEMSFLWGKIFKKSGEFDEEVYKGFLKNLENEALVQEIEANADEGGKIRQKVSDKKEMTEDLKENLSTLARFALAKAVSIASHGII